MKWTWLKVIQDLYCWSPSIWIKALRANWHRWKFNLVNGFGQSFHNCSCWCCFPICNTINWRKIIYYSQENLSLARRKTLKLISVAQISNGSQKFELLLWAWALSSVLSLDSLGCIKNIAQYCLALFILLCNIKWNIKYRLSKQQI